MLHSSKLTRVASPPSTNTPTDPTKIIKVTADAADAKNIANFQSLPNVVRLYKNAKVGAAYVLLVDFVDGPSMPYTGNTLLAIINGDNWDDVESFAKGKPLRMDKMRSKILKAAGKFDSEEVDKLGRLFKTLGTLAKRGVDVLDLTDNIIDNGTDYIIIDMGMT